MSLTKKDLEAKVKELKASNESLEAELTARPLPETVEDQKEITVEELLTKINGFEGAVAEVKHLKIKAAANSENKHLARELNSKLAAVNAVLKSISVKVN